MIKTNQTAMVYENPKERIEQGYYSPAESPPETNLANEYNVSRNTIKKAFLMLENDALVTIEQNKGAKVRSYSKVEVLEFLELREEPEGFIVRLAVPCFDMKAAKKLEELTAEMAAHKAASNLMAYSTCNLKFYNVIYGICPNRTAIDITVRLKNQIRKYNGKTALIPGRDEKSYQEHCAILEAIEQKDATEAEQYMHQHIRNARNTFDEFYSLLLQYESIQTREGLKLL